MYSLKPVIIKKKLFCYSIQLFHFILKKLIKKINEDDSINFKVNKLFYADVPG